ncbi:hypothetical protein FHU13_004791 [Methylobacterium sp. R2-1]|nr:hypothetical protein [Methylobacterium sp. R2-1]
MADRRRDVIETAFAPRRPVRGAEVIGECLMSACNVAFAASCRAHFGAVSDDSLSGSDDTTLGIAAGSDEIETGAFGCVRHSFLMRSIASSVVYSFPGTNSVTSRPRSRSRRRPEAVLPPSGKASAASARRSGVVRVISGAPDARTLHISASRGGGWGRGGSLAAGPWNPMVARLHRSLPRAVGCAPTIRPELVPWPTLRSPFTKPASSCSAAW